MFLGPFFQGRGKILLLVEALKSGVMFQKFALKLFTIWKIMEKNSEKRKTISFLCARWGEK